MRTLIGTFACMTLLVLACQPDPLPELREQSLGRWKLSLSGYVNYPYGLRDRYYVWMDGYELLLIEDGTYTISKDTIFRGFWRHESRDFITMDIPEGFLLPHLGKIEAEFTKNQNMVSYQYWNGFGKYETDTASMDEIKVYVDFDMRRIP
ncbi:MAG: hypothetical protein AAF927_32605 [Bacteroidota bacterium]